VKKFFLLLCCLVLWHVPGWRLIGLYYWASSDLPSFRKITDYRPPLVTTIYTRDNKVLGYLYSEKRFLVTLGEMPGICPRPSWPPRTRPFTSTRAWTFRPSSGP
jgi:penicillin-binding protein 1A